MAKEEVTAKARYDCHYDHDDCYAYYDDYYHHDYDYNFYYYY